MKSLLITATGGDIGSAVVRALRRYEGELYLVGCDINAANQGLEYLDAFYLVPRYTQEYYYDAIRNVCQECQIECIIPTTEAEIQIFSSHRSELLKSGIKVMINKSSILDVCLNKYTTAKYLEKLHLGVPGTIKMTAGYHPDKFPIVMKSEYGNGSQTVKVIHNEKEWIAYQPEEGCIAQEYIGTPDEEYTVGVFSDGKDVRTIAFRRKLENNGGMTVYVELIFDNNIDKISKVVAKSFNLEGFLNLQMRKQGGEYYIFEINPRISGTVGFRSKLGFHDVIWWLEFLYSEKIGVYLPVEGKYIGVKKYDDLMFEYKGDTLRILGGMDKRIEMKEDKKLSWGGYNGIGICLAVTNQQVMAA